MRIVGSTVAIWITGLALILHACSDEPIGQPCTFSWPVAKTEDGKDLVTDCTAYPACAPLQNTAGTPQAEPANEACPVDCLQTQSLECTNLICVATEVEQDTAEHPKEQLMNGQCSKDVVFTECSDQASFGCMGYCTKVCLSNASCPKGYRCTPTAPFGENLRCDREEDWAGDVNDPQTDQTKCTDDCQSAGFDLGEGDFCPTSKTPDDYSLCEVKKYARCCACICNRYCSLLEMKFCRKVSWDQQMFPNGVIPASTKRCSVVPE